MPFVKKVTVADLKKLIPETKLDLHFFYNFFFSLTSVYRERSLQTVTNWFIVSLAFADLFVTIPMLFSLYVMVSSIQLSLSYVFMYSETLPVALLCARFRQTDK